MRVAWKGQDLTIVGVEGERDDLQPVVVDMDGNEVDVSYDFTSHFALELDELWFDKCLSKADFWDDNL
jgi:hypothetical protein